MISKRLLACAEYVRKTSNVCDVGCDHGYLSCHLVENNIANKVFATDINEMPLQSAKNNIKAAGFSGKITAILSDGLQEISGNEVDDVIIAGMGGELILKIIEDSSWIKDSKKTLILQPMTNIPILRTQLYKLGFEIVSETAVDENGHWYTVIKSLYTGNRQEISAAFSHVGQHMSSLDLNSIKYIEHILAKLKIVAENLNKAANKEIEKICYYNSIILEIENTLKKENRYES